MAISSLYSHSPTQFPTTWLAQVWVSTPGNSNLVATFQEFVASRQFLLTNWTRQMDEAVSLLRLRDPAITQSKTIPPDLGSNDPALLRVPRLYVWLRLQLFVLFQRSETLTTALAQSSKRIKDLQRACQVAVPLEAKLASVHKIVFAGISNAGNQPVLMFDRFRARRFYLNPRDPRDSLLGQFVSATNRDIFTRMKRNGVPWSVLLAVERPIDAGGPGRELFSEVCLEVMHPELGLFVTTPNHKLKESVANQDVLIPNPAPFRPDSVRAQMYFYTGALIGLCYVCTSP
jgi:hypothetical protein